MRVMASFVKVAVPVKDVSPQGLLLVPMTINSSPVERLSSTGLISNAVHVVSVVQVSSRMALGLSLGGEPGCSVFDIPLYALFSPTAGRAGDSVFLLFAVGELVALAVPSAPDPSDVGGGEVSPPQPESKRTLVSSGPRRAQGWRMIVPLPKSVMLRKNSEIGEPSFRF